MPVAVARFSNSLLGIGGVALSMLYAPMLAAQSCSITAANGAYGSVDILSGSAVDTTTTFSVACTGTANAIVRLCVELSPGQTTSGQRRLAAGTFRLLHELYADAARSIVWGSWGLSSTAYSTAGQQHDLTLNSSGAGSANFTVYGRVWANQQTVGPGSFVWTMTTAPSVGYAYKAASACPTGSLQSTSGGSSWSATIANNCLISASSLDFGSTAATISSNVDATGTISVQCTNSTPYSIGLGNGLNASGSQRRMRLGATSNYVNYNLYVDSGRTNAWTTTSSASSCSGGASTCYLGTGAGTADSVPIYGRVPTQSVSTTGTYTDTVVMTVTF